MVQHNAKKNKGRQKQETSRIHKVQGRRKNFKLGSQTIQRDILLIIATPAKPPKRTQDKMAILKHDHDVRNSLRGRPEQITSVGEEAFQSMDHDLKSSIMRVFQSLENATTSQQNTPQSDMLPLHKRISSRQTRSSADVSSHFYKSLVPPGKPTSPREITVEFAGSNEILTKAPGWMEKTSYGNGVWLKERNGVVETGRMSEDEEIIIAEQMNKTIESITRHTASELTGMMGNWWGNSARKLSMVEADTPRPNLMRPRGGSDEVKGRTDEGNSSRSLVRIEESALVEENSTEPSMPRRKPRVEGS
jgi:hypothetical protein